MPDERRREEAMSIESLIFFYAAVSILMGLFDFGVLIYERCRDKSFARRSQKMAVLLSREIEAAITLPLKRHERLLRRKMRWLSGLESFDLTMMRLEAQDPDASERYAREVAPKLFERLAPSLQSKSYLHKAYFAYLIRRWHQGRPASTSLIAVLLRYVSDESLYTRQNALEALAQVGTPQALVEALTIIDGHAEFHHPKLITEVAMAWSGKIPELASELDRRFNELSPVLQAAVINFMRMRGQGDPDRLLGLLADERADAEIRLACIRYFTRHQDERATPILRVLARSEDAGRWEYAAVAATALGSYRDDESISVLVRCLSSPIWHVRFNAAKSLYDAGLSLEGPRLKPVMAGGDRYAREMLRYRWEIEEEIQGSRR